MLKRCLIAGFFFFQAEDGIRDLVRSRGLGDVYKRQVLESELSFDDEVDEKEAMLLAAAILDLRRAGVGPVSYTHLTLPTSDLV